MTNTQKLINTFDKWLEGRVNSLTKKNYISQANKFNNLYPTFPTNPNPSVVEDYLRKGLDSRTYNRKYAIKQFIEFLASIEIIDIEDYDYIFDKRYLAYKVKDREDTQILDYKQLINLVNNMDDKELKLILMMAFDTGGRIRAILKIRVQKDINNVTREVLLREKRNKSYLRE